MPYITFEREGKTIACNAGENLRQLALKNDISLYSGLYKIANCRGNGLCTSCEVEIVEGDRISPRSRMEESQLSKKPLSRRLSCQVVVHDDLTVRTRPPKWQAPIEAETTE